MLMRAGRARAGKGGVGQDRAGQGGKGKGKARRKREREQRGPGRPEVPGPTQFFPQTRWAHGCGEAGRRIGSLCAIEVEGLKRRPPRAA